MSEHADIPRRWFAPLLAMLLLAAALVGLHTATAARPLETHEVFVAQTVREMIARGDYMVPTFGGELRLKKPPLMYWLVAGLATAADRPDVPEWVARAPAAIASVLLVGACVLIGARVYDRRTGLLAGVVVAFSSGVFEYAGNARPEMIYAACSAMGIAGFVVALRSPARSLVWALSGWAWMGLALLAKGPQLPALMLLGFSGYVLAARGFGEWRRAVRPALGVVVMLLVAAPWVLVVMGRVEGAAAVWKNELIGLRFGGGDDAGPETGSGFVAWLLEVLKPKYLLYMMSTLLPWGLLMPLGAVLVWQKQRPDLAAGRDVFFALAGGVLGLSLASHSRDYYLLPVLPLLGVLIARALVDLLDRAGAASPTAGRRWAWGLGLLALGGVGFGVGVRVHDGADARDLVVVGACVAVGALAVWWVRRGMRLDGRTTTLGAAAAAWAVGFGVVGHEPVLFSERRMRVDEVARAAAAASGNDKPVLAVGFDPNDLIYRLRRPARAVETDVGAAEVLASAPCVLVAPPSVLDRLSAEGVVMTRGEVIPVRKSTPFVVATVVGR